MKKIITLFTLFLIASTASVSAQDDVRPDYANRRAALLFTFSGLANIGAGNFEGGIGGKYFLNPMMAVRAGLSFSTISETVPSQAANGKEGKTSATGFGLNGAIEYHLASTRVSPYIGGGFGLSTTSTESKDPVNANQDQVTIKNNLGGETISGTTYNAGTSISLYALLGAEFFIYRELSLAAEYRLGFISTSRSDQERTVGNVTDKTKGGSISQFGVESQGFITLAFYF